jgi:hypothetical protein
VLKNALRKNSNFCKAIIIIRLLPFCSLSLVHKTIRLRFQSLSSQDLFAFRFNIFEIDENHLHKTIDTSFRQEVDIRMYFHGDAVVVRVSVIGSKFRPCQN